LDFGYSRKFSEKLAVGVALRYINSSLANGYNNNGVTYKAGNALLQIYPFMAITLMMLDKALPMVSP
jgi:hypothetical protein